MNFFAQQVLRYNRLGRVGYARVAALDACFDGAEARGMEAVDCAGESKAAVQYMFKVLQKHIE